MAERVAAIFHSRDTAERAAKALVDLGADPDHISLLGRGDESTVDTTPVADHAHREGRDFIEPARQVGDTGAPMTTADDNDAAEGAATGAAIGAVAGLAAGAMALFVPGFGLVLAAGPLAWALGGAAGAAAAGAIAGGVYGGLRDIGVHEQYARGYEERIRGGDILMTALVPTVAEDRVLDVLAEHGAEDVSFADDTAISQTPVSPDEAAVNQPELRIEQRGDRFDTTRPAPADAPERQPAPYHATASAVGVTAVPVTPAEATVPSPEYRTVDQTDRLDRTASYADSVVGATATDGAAFDSDVAQGEAKQVEGEIRDRAADRTANPMDDLAAKGKKMEGKIQEEYGEATETIEPRRP